MLKNLEGKKLTVGQMKDIAGGSWGESYFIDLKNAYDRKMKGFENMDPMSGDTAVYCLQNWDSVVGNLKDMFARHGIEMTYKGKPTESNIYMYEGKKITSDEAWKIIDSHANG